MTEFRENPCRGGAFRPASMRSPERDAVRRRAAGDRAARRAALGAIVALIHAGGSVLAVVAGSPGRGARAAPEKET